MVLSVKNFLVPVLVVQMTFGSLGVAQSPKALSSRKVQDYFQDVESKSYYQQERIRSMKGEMNEYSERLHSLQEKFQKIFYGRSTDELHQSPFGDKEKISYPKRKYRDPIPLEDVESIVRRPSNRTETNPPSNQLAFTVEDSTPSIEPEESLENDFEPTQLANFNEPTESFSRRTDEPEEVTFSPSSSSFGGYLILRPGVAIPYKDQTTHNGSTKTRHREYKTGMSISLAGGYRWKGWKFGGGVLYRENEHDSGSYERNGGNTEPFAGGSQSSSIAGFIESAYTHSFNPWFGVYGTVSLGYGVSRIEDFAPSPGGHDRTRLDPFFFASGGLGLSWTPSEHFAASLGYRYLHEKEVPAHAIELGLEGKF
ncbi:MAG: porin family protein [Opitutae bacterium]|nr:porin family protein [Opitutae bacterium]